MYQNSFGGRALPGPAGELERSPRPPSRKRGPTSKGRGKEGKGRGGEALAVEPSHFSTGSDASVASRVCGAERAVLYFGKLLFESNEKKFGFRGVES